MTARLLGTFEPGSPEWHAARAQGIGGSEIAAVLGLSPFESRFSLWHRKAGNVGPVDETPEMEWGKRLEPVVLAAYREKHADLDYTVVNGTFVPDGRPWQIANPDLLAADRVIECKTSPFGDAWGQAGTDEIPPHVRCQVIWYCDVLDQAQADIVLLVGGCDYREYHVTYDPVEAAELRAAAVEFLDTLHRGERPDIDAHSATWQALRELHPDIEPVDVDLDGRLAHRYCVARHQLAAATTEEQHARSLVADAMGFARRARWDGRTIATRQARGDGLPYLVAGRNLPTAHDFEETAAA